MSLNWLGGLSYSPCGYSLGWDVFEETRILPLTWFWNIFTLNQWLGNITFISKLISSFFFKILFCYVLVGPNIAWTNRSISALYSSSEPQGAYIEYIPVVKGAEIHPGRGHQSTAGHTPSTYAQRGSFRSPVDLICMSFERTRRKPETVLLYRWESEEMQQFSTKWVLAMWQQQTRPYCYNSGLSSTVRASNHQQHILKGGLCYLSYSAD